MKLIIQHGLKQIADSLANYMPNDKFIFGHAKFNKDDPLRELINGLSVELQRTNQNVFEFFEQLDPMKADKTIADWEKAVGIPDGIFNDSGTIEKRKKQVIVKFFKSAQTVDEFVELANFFGFELTLTPKDQDGTGSFEDKMTVIVKGSGIIPSVLPYDIPKLFGHEVGVIKNIFETLKPSDVKFIYINND